MSVFQRYVRPLFANVGNSAYVAFQAEHVNQIGNPRELPLPIFLNGFGMAIVLVISGFWSAPAHGDLTNGFT